MAITYGYVRVSTADQNEARQIDAMKLVGVCPESLVIDKQSGKYAEIIEEWRSIVSGKGADIRVLAMPLLDTTNNIDGLIGRFVADIVLQTMSFIAEPERKNIRERQQQGIAAARLRGVRFGRPRNQLPDNFTTCADLVKPQKFSIGLGAALCGMKRLLDFPEPRGAIAGTAEK